MSIGFVFWLKCYGFSGDFMPDLYSKEETILKHIRGARATISGVNSTGYTAISFIIKV